MNRLPIYILHSDTNGAATYLDSLAVKIARFSGRTPLLSLEIHPRRAHQPPGKHRRKRRPKFLLVPRRMLLLKIPKLQMPR